MKRNKRGVSLIVLVITIIVMIILASAVMISLSSTNIFNRADEAVDASDLAQVKTLAALAWQEAYLDSLEDDTVDFKNRVVTALRNNDITVWEDNDTYRNGRYMVKVTDRGVDVYPVAVTWSQDGKKVTGSDGQEIDVGTTVKIKMYNEDKDAEVYTANNYNTWVVLGAEEGQLLLVSDTDIATGVIIGGKYGGTIKSVWSNVTEECVAGYYNAVEYLDNLCKPYLNSKYATEARSIKMRDINRTYKYVPAEDTTNTTYGQETVYTSDFTHIDGRVASETNPITVTNYAYSYEDAGTGDGSISFDVGITSLNNAYFWVADTVCGQDGYYSNKYAYGVFGRLNPGGLHMQACWLTESMSISGGTAMGEITEGTGAVRAVVALNPGALVTVVE